jgi:hypothetical protein
MNVWNKFNSSQIGTDHKIFWSNPKVCVISDFRLEVANNCALLGYYEASSGNSLQTFLYTFWFLNPKDGTDIFSRKVSKNWPRLAA